jgi:hypothetical protein
MHKILIYLHIIYLLKFSTCFNHHTAHLQEVWVVFLSYPVHRTVTCRDLRYQRLHIYNYGVDLLKMSRVMRETCRKNRRIFKGEKILSTPSFGGELKPSVPCRKFAAGKIFLKLRGSRILDEICRNISRPRRVPPSASRGLPRRWTWRHLAEKVETSKSGEKQWQTTPNNLPRMQCARAIPVTWLCSGSC